jgi:hypothetical protein
MNAVPQSEPQQIADLAPLDLPDLARLERQLAASVLAGQPRRRRKKRFTGFVGGLRKS